MLIVALQGYRCTGAYRSVPGTQVHPEIYRYTPIKCNNTSSSDFYNNIDLKSLYVEVTTDVLAIHGYNFYIISYIGGGIGYPYTIIAL